MTPAEAFAKAQKAQKAQAKPGTWAERFAIKRRAIDRAILAEAERMITAQEIADLEREVERGAEERERIARAFGRPYD